ncbi:hypothetical protein [Kitasatospora sp. NPDC004531]
MTQRELGGDPDWLPASPPLPKGESSMARPDPGDVRTPQEFVGRLRELKAWSGNPSLRELERRTSCPRSTLAGDLNPQRSRLPPLERVLALGVAFGTPVEELARWKAAWQRVQVVEQAAELAEPEVAVAEREVLRGAEEPEARAGRRRTAGLRPAWPLLPVGGLVVALLALLSAAAPVGGGRAVGDRPSSPGMRQLPDDCGYLGRIGDEGTGSPREAAVTTGESLQIARPVAAGDTLIVTLVLAGAAAGPITVRDTAGNRYRAVRDETAGDTRLTVFALFDARPLDSLDQITFRWPSAKHDHTSIDEFRGSAHLAPGGNTEQCGDGGATTALRDSTGMAPR